VGVGVGVFVDVLLGVGVGVGSGTSKKYVHFSSITKIVYVPYGCNGGVNKEGSNSKGKVIVPKFITLLVLDGLNNTFVNSPS
jgi:hypothetical protein